MATRMYIDFNGFRPNPSFTPSVRGSWGTTNLTQRYHIAPAGHSTLRTAIFTTRSVNTNSSAGTIVHALCYSPPMNTSYDWSGVSVTCTLRTSEASTTQNCFLQIYWGIISNDGSTLKGISPFAKGAVEYATSLTSRSVTSSTGIAVISEPGDRLFVEIGWDKDGAVAGSIAHQYGYSTSAADLTSSGDTNIRNPWIELSNDVIFDDEGTTYSNALRQLMLTGIGL